MHHCVQIDRKKSYYLRSQRHQRRFRSGYNGIWIRGSRGSRPSIRDGVLRSGMLLYLHHINFKIFFHPAKFDNFKDEKISDFKTVSVSQRKNLLD